MIVGCLVAVVAVAARRALRRCTAAPLDATRSSGSGSGEWSGPKSLQTESFTSDTGAFRITWDDTRRRKAPGEGTFLLTLHSAISGRPLQIAVDHRGPGGATAYLNDDPRVFFAVVDASNIEWSFTVDEAVATRIVPGSPDAAFSCEFANRQPPGYNPRSLDPPAG